MNASSMTFELIRRPLVTWRGGEARLNAACLTALLKAWPRAQSRYLVSYGQDDVVVYKPPADPLRYLQVRILFFLLCP